MKFIRYFFFLPDMFVLYIDLLVVQQRLMCFCGEIRRYQQRCLELLQLYGFCLNCLNTTFSLWFVTSWYLHWRCCSCGPMLPLLSTSKLLILWFDLAFWCSAISVSWLNYLFWFWLGVHLRSHKCTFQRNLFCSLPLLLDLISIGLLLY